MQGFEFNTVKRIISGAGSALQLADQCRQLGIARPLLVTDPGLMAIGLVQPVLAALEREGVVAVVFDQVREDPPEATVLAAADLGRSQSVDGVLAVGGGSSMDVAKVVAVLVEKSGFGRTPHYAPVTIAGPAAPGEIVMASISGAATMRINEPQG